MHSADLTENNIEKLAALFPNCITESKDAQGNLKKSIDFDLLRQELSDHIVDGPEERYRLDWPGKREALFTANAPIAKTLRPCREESVDFETTQNLYIEGDNMEALKLLQENYLGRVKMIYIDPPYNTGKDFVYADDFAEGRSEYFKKALQKNENGDRMVANLEANGRLHSDWLSMMYIRLKLSKNLLKDDGVILISIDDHEADNLKKICDECFGSENFIGNMVWRGGRRNAAKVISTSHEYMVAYARNLNFCIVNDRLWREKKRGLELIYEAAERFVKSCNNDYEKASEMLVEWYNELADSEPAKDHDHYSNIDFRGVYFASDISRGGGGGPMWQIKNPKTGEIVSTPERGWAYSRLENLQSDIDNERVHFNGSNVPCRKSYLKDSEYQLIDTVFYKDRRGASKRIKALFDKRKIFDFPKDELILKEKFKSFTDKDSLVLDFFGGASTTAHAIMQLNAEDGGTRKFILVQIAEATPEKSEGRKAGFETIAEIGKERIRRAGKKVRGDLSSALLKLNQKKKGQLEIGAQEYYQNPDELDIGFRVLKVDTSNMEDVYYKPDQLEQGQLSLHTENIKPDRTEEDLLFQVLLDWGLELSLPIRKETIKGLPVYFVDENALAACFAGRGEVTEEFCKELAAHKPLRVVFRDSGFKSDAVKINVDQVFKMLSSGTEIKTL